MTSHKNLTFAERLVYLSDVLTRTYDAVVASAVSLRKDVQLWWKEQTTRSTRAERFVCRFLREVKGSPFAFRKIGRLKFLLFYYPKTLMRVNARVLSPIISDTLVDCVRRGKMRQARDYANLFLHRGSYSSDAQARHFARNASAALVRDVPNKNDAVLALLFLMAEGYKINLKILHNALVQQEYSHGRGNNFSEKDAVYEHPARYKYRNELVVVVEKMMAERRARADEFNHELSEGQRRIM